jgi:hypothetical protein
VLVEIKFVVKIVGLLAELSRYENMVILTGKVLLLRVSEK